MLVCLFSLALKNVDSISELPSVQLIRHVFLSVWLFWKISKCRVCLGGHELSTYLCSQPDMIITRTDIRQPVSHQQRVFLSFSAFVWFPVKYTEKTERLCLPALLMCAVFYSPGHLQKWNKLPGVWPAQTLYLSWESPELLLLGTVFLGCQHLPTRAVDCFNFCQMADFSFTMSLLWI